MLGIYSLSMKVKDQDMKKLKSSFIIWISIYPSITSIMILFGEDLAKLPIALRTLVLTIILVPLMVYVLVPFWTKVFAVFSKGNTVK